MPRSEMYLKLSGQMAVFQIHAGSFPESGETEMEKRTAYEVSVSKLEYSES